MVTTTLKHQYSTLILPINFTYPANWSVYKCTGVSGNVLELAEHPAGNVDKNMAFIVEYTDAESLPTTEAPKIYQLIGYSNGAATEDQVTGYMTGVLTAGGTTVPYGSYVLAYDKNADRQGFFVTDGTVVCPQYKCYLTVPASPTNAFYFDNQSETTGIEAIFGGSNEEVVIYNVAGQRINRLQKGVNIVNGRKVLVK